MKLPLFAAIAALAVAATLSPHAHAQPINCSIDWNTSIATASSQAYGLNLYKGYDPDIAGQTGSTAYKTNVKWMNPGIVRYHRAGNDGQMSDSTLKSSGWVIDPDTNPRWDRAKIQSALRGSFSFYPVKLMNIVNWPKAWQRSATDRRLRPDKITTYANFCVDLVRAINIEMGPNYAIDEWEVLNEPDAIYSGTTGAGEVADIYVAVSNKMRELRVNGGYPTKSGRPLEIGGPAFANTFYDQYPQGLNRFVHEFVRLTVRKLDFISYHQYGSTIGRVDNRELLPSEYFDRAETLGQVTGRVRKSVELLYGTAPRPAYYHDEYNLLANAGGASSGNRDAQSQITGAIFDAIGMASMIRDGADATLAWNESDGWYGKLDDDINYTKRAGAYVYQLYNAHLRGSVKDSDAAATTFTVYPVSSGKKNFALINKCLSQFWSAPVRAKRDFVDSLRPALQTRPLR